MKAIVIVLILCVSRTLTEDNFEENSYRVALKVYDECSKGEFFACLKKKAIVMLDRLGRMEKISIANGVTIIRDADEAEEKSNVTGADFERNLSKEESLDEMLVDKFTRLVGSRRLEISLPKMLQNLQEDDNNEIANSQARGDLDFGGGGGGHGGGGGGGHGGGGGGGGGKKKKGNGMNGMMMLIGAKLSMLGALAIGGLFLLAKKALITAKIALMISAIIGLKKLFASKGGSTKVQDVWASQGHGGGGYGGHGGGGWAPSGGGGGWDKKSFNAIPYSAHQPEKYD